MSTGLATPPRHPRRRRLQRLVVVLSTSLCGFFMIAWLDSSLYATHFTSLVRSGVQPAPYPGVVIGCGGSPLNSRKTSRPPPPTTPIYRTLLYSSDGCFSAFTTHTALPERSAVFGWWSQREPREGKFVMFNPPTFRYVNLVNWNAGGLCLTINRWTWGLRAQYWFLVLVCALPGFFSLVNGWLAGRRLRRMGLCPHCGYSRLGLADAAPCPECGRMPLLCSISL